MPTNFKNAKYYNLVNNTLLDPYLVKKYTEEVLITDNLKVLYLIGFIDDKRPNRLNANHFYLDNKSKSIYNLNFYLDWLGMNLSWAEYNILFKVLSKNTYKIRDLLINAFINAENTYFITNIVNPISRKLALDKIKRNSIYNLGLGLKLSIKAFKEDFD